MKKIIFLTLALTFIIGLGFSSCKDDGTSRSELIETFCQWSIACEMYDDNTTQVECELYTDLIYEISDCGSLFTTSMNCMVDMECDDYETCADEMNATGQCLLQIDFFN
ncbi:hypothetical protein ACFL20_11450 [Spirochaetota bacterium]